MSRSSVELANYSETIKQPPLLKLTSKNDHATPTLNDETGTQLIIDPFSTDTVIPDPNNATTAIVLVTVVCVTTSSSLLAGLVTVGLPTMAHELGLSPSVLLWYVYPGIDDGYC
jgi:hypothetical protein